MLPAISTDGGTYADRPFYTLANSLEMKSRYGGYGSSRSRFVLSFSDGGKHLFQESRFFRNCANQGHQVLPESLPPRLPFATLGAWAAAGFQLCDFQL